MVDGSDEHAVPIWDFDSNLILWLPLLAGKSNGSFDQKKTAIAGVIIKAQNAFFRNFFFINKHSTEVKIFYVIYGSLARNTKSIKRDTNANTANIIR